LKDKKKKYGAIRNKYPFLITLIQKRITQAKFSLMKKHKVSAFVQYCVRNLI